MTTIYNDWLMRATIHIYDAKSIEWNYTKLCYSVSQPPESSELSSFLAMIVGMP
jgi:hypothetical protein